MKGLIRLLVVGSLLALGLVFTACGGSDEAASTSGGGGTTAAAEPSGEPVKVGVIAPVNAPTLSLPDVVAAAQIAERSVNAAGGVDGRPLQVVTCDDKDNPQQAAVCARKLLDDDGVTMLVGGFTQHVASVYPALAQADTIWFGDNPTQPADVQNPRSYPFGPGFTAFSALFQLVPEGTEDIAYLAYESPVSKGIVEAAQGGLLPAGATLTPVYAPFTTVDFKPLCLRAQQANASVVFTGFAPGVTGKALQACAQAGLEDATYMLGSVTLNPQDVSLIDGLGLETTVAIAFHGPRVEQWHEDLEAYGDEIEVKDPLADNNVNTYAAITLAAEVFAQAGDDPAAIKAYLDEQSAFETGYTPTLDLSKPGEGAPRQFNTSVLPGTIEDGEIVPTSDEYVSGS